MVTATPAWWAVEWQRDEYDCDVARAEIRIGGRMFRISARFDGRVGDWWIEDEAGNLVFDSQPEWYARREDLLREALDVAGRILGA